MENTVFSWASALQDFLDPNNHVTPLVELPPHLNPYHEDGVCVFLKLQTFLPLGNIKSISARGMLKKLQDEGQCEKTHTIVENSSGNTAFSLAVLGRTLGISHMRARVSNEITRWKLQLLQLFGVQPVVNQEQICPNPNDRKSWIYKAQSEGTQCGWYNPDQYHNLANPEIHYQLTGQQIWKQILTLDTSYNFQFFCAGLGTTGTFIGITKYLKEQNPDFIALWVVRKPNNPIPWPRTLHLLQQIGFDWKNYVDDLQEVSSKQAYETSLQLIRSGLVVGPSSWMALAGLFAQLQKMKTEWSLLQKKKKNQKISAVVICPDGPYVYLEEYMKYCDPKVFPDILNQDLLLEKYEEMSMEQNDTLQITCQDAFQHCYTPQSREKYEKTQYIPDLILAPEYVAIDLRTQDSFEHVHLQGFQCLPLDKLQLSDFSPYRSKKIFLLCSYGKQSAYLASKLHNIGYDVVSITGGLAEWSDENLPRIRSQECSL